MPIAKQRGDPNLRTILRRAVCRFPTEWDRSTIEKRHEWTRNPAEKLLLDDPVHWKNFCLHLTAISFDDLPVEYKAADWRFHPAEFIATFRQCGWLSKRKLTAIYPDEMYNRIETPNPSNRREKFRIHINRAMRKYFISTGTRQAHFLGQGAVESAFLARMIETSVTPSRNPSHGSVQPEISGYYTSSHDPYFDKYEFRLGNTNTGDGIKFRDRGLKQLTALENYSKYWMYRAWLPANSFNKIWWVDAATRTPAYKDKSKISPYIPDPERISINDWNCIGAGAWYWEAGAARMKFTSINSIIQEGNVSDQAVFSVSRAINGIDRSTNQPNGLPERTRQTQRISQLICDN